jgi:rhamnose utilization protein RhaD (predicted bifunctional aldolase and dehydrogenase)/NAD(P)-dependent dehydrogenase (short-subunit alcohol dehydrogenase family)
VQMQNEPQQPGSGPSEPLMEKLVALSRKIGSDIELVIAGGGNTSAKSWETLYVKGSGTALAEATPESFVAMSRDQLISLLARDLGTNPVAREERFKEAILAARLHPEKNQRPSVEAVLHALIPKQFVVHSHATSVNMVTCAADGPAIAAELFGDDALWIPYVDPGFVLAVTLNRALEDYAANTGRGCPQAILMQNHGLIVCADSPEEILSCSEKLVRRVKDHLLGKQPGSPFGPQSGMGKDESKCLINNIGPMLRGLLAESARLKTVTFDDSPETIGLVCGAAGKSAAIGGPLTPDQIVYCNSYPLWFEPRSDEKPETLLERLKGAIGRHLEESGYPPLVVLVRGLGMFTVGDDLAQAETVRLCYIDAIKVMAGAKCLRGIRPMPERDRRFIETWEVESYRKKVAAASRSKGLASGKIAIVTGAAQGFGLEIARDLAAEGAHVVLTDINEAGASGQADMLNRQFGARRSSAFALDVTDSGSAAEMIHRVVRRFGGFDLFISNAGVLRAGSVLTQPEKDFDLVTRVNYRGYFTCVQAAAPSLALQHLARPDYWSDIIQINSKSGLAGSNRNGAYAGSKFGGIGLTQSFALELVESGIKVNAICPGNFFDGPLWSDPENGLFVQYLRTGKVPGARTIDEVRRHYEAKVPMGRGCTGADVMKAIYYLVSQQYETGQALPVTGGQVMLN